MAEIVVVDDEADLALMVAELLEMAEHTVRTAHDGKALRQAIAQRPADLVVLDRRLPGEDGLGLARWLREHHDPGIVILTGADGTLERILGLEIGADDYLAKPFEPAELVARVEAVLRRRRPGARLPDGCLAFGPYVLDRKARRLLDPAGREVPLAAMELELVAAFARHPGRVLSRDALLDLAPARGDDPFDRAIDNRITRLRRKLERDAAKPELIKTVRGAGYLHPGG
jgi:DNA-binding response OmpR family regulator